MDSIGILLTIMYVMKLNIAKECIVPQIGSIEGGMCECVNVCVSS